MGEQAREVAAVSTGGEGPPVEPLDYDSLSIEELGYRLMVAETAPVRRCTT